MNNEIKFVEPLVELVKESDIIKKIEKAFRVCYKSENKMNDTSDGLVTRFLQNRKPDRHTSPAEHAWIEISGNRELISSLLEFGICFRNNYIRYYLDDDIHHRLVGNIRAFLDLFIANSSVDDYNNWCYQDAFCYRLAYLLWNKFPKLFPKPKFDGWINSSVDYDKLERVISSDDDTVIKEYDEYKTFHIVTSRDILQELVRHRTFSFSVESTRYCNYNKKGMQFVIPRPYEWCDYFDWNDKEAVTELNIKLTRHHNPITDAGGNTVGISDVICSTYDESIKHCANKIESFVLSCLFSTTMYNELINRGVKPQEARMILPGSLKTELYMTGTIDQWKQFLILRNSEAAHPQIRYLAEKIDKLIN